MIFWASTPTPCTETWHTYAARRVTFKACADGIGLFGQGQSRADGSWKTDSFDAVLYVDTRPKFWRIGRTHLYYDGPHCIWRFGPICFIRESTDCRECWGES